MAISDYLGWVKLSPRYLLALALVSIFLLIAPENITKTLGWENFVTEYKPWIGLVALVSTALLLSHGLAKVAPLVMDTIMEKRSIKKCKEYLKHLTPDEKLILSDYMLLETKTTYLNIQDGVVNGLVDAGIIYRASNVGYWHTGLAHNLQDWAWEELNKHPEYLQPVVAQRAAEFRTRSKDKE
jgi:hypothetical protein